MAFVHWQRNGKYFNWNSLVMIVSLVATFATIGFCANPPVQVGGQEVALGQVRVLVPEGDWYREDPEAEAGEEAAIFYYRGVDAPDDEALPRYMVRIEDTVDTFSSATELAAFYRRVEKNLVASGWKQGRIPFKGQVQACYINASGTDETTFLVQLPFKTKSLTTYVVVPRTGAGFPKSALPFLEAITVR